MPDQQSAEITPLISREHVENAFWTALRMFVGRGRRHSADEVSKGAGVHRRTLDCYRGYEIGSPDWRPLDQGQKFSIAAYIGADLTTEWLKLIGQGAFNLPDIEPDPGELAAETTESAARVVRMAVDGDFGNDCPQELRNTGTSLMEQGAHLVAIGSRNKRRVA